MKDFLEVIVLFKMPIASCGSLYTSRLTHRFEMRLPWKRTSAAYSLIDELTEQDFVVCGVYKPLYNWHGKLTMYEGGKFHG